MKTAWPIAALLAALIAHGAALEPPDVLATQVRAAETAFARSMADRDLEAFASHVAEDAVFFAGNGVLRGRVAVVAGWKPLYDGPKAPFSWKPDQVEVLDSGTLAHSSGPVLNPEGKQVGTFNSIWRREADGSWKIVFDKGCPACNCAAIPAEPKN